MRKKIRVGDLVKCNISPLDIYYGKMSVVEVNGTDVVCKCWKGDGLHFQSHELERVVLN